MIKENLMDKPIIIILNGSGGCGKDTFVDLCRKAYPLSIWHISTITPIKEAAEILGWDGTKTEENRKFLSDLKDMATNLFDASYNYIKNKIEHAKTYNVEVVFIDCREPEEIQRLKTDFGAITLLIDASARRPDITSNHADANVYKYRYDITIKNNGTMEEFNEKAKEFMKYIRFLMESGNSGIINRTATCDLYN
jgi:guanylate kinase